MRILYFIIFGIFIYSFFISLLTGFFAIYYYDRNIHKNIRINNLNLGYTSHIMILSIIFFIITCITIFYNMYKHSNSLTVASE